MGRLDFILLCPFLSALYLISQHQGIIEEDLIWGFIPGIGLFFITTSVLLCFITEKMRNSETKLFNAVQKLDQMNQNLESAQVILSSYLAPQLAEKILNGETDEVVSHNRQKLTLFFADIKDFTATTDAMEAEDLVGVLNHYLDEMVSIAIGHGGTVAQISGDGLFIFFGAPEFSNDGEHATQCVSDGNRYARTDERARKFMVQIWRRASLQDPLRD